MKDVDLNLLRVFEILYQERSVTRAAARLHLTQSAVSHALKRLRQAIGDRLFVRTASGLQPTARATVIAPRVREALMQLNDVLAASRFDPATTRRRFNLAAGSYFCTLLVPRLVSLLREVAPAASVQVWSAQADLFERFDNGQIDLALMAHQPAPQRIRTERLFDEELVWVAASASQALFPDVAAVKRAPRVLIESNRYSDGGRTAAAFAEVAEASTRKGGSESSIDPVIAAVVYDSATALAVVERSDAVALVPRRFAERRAEDGRVFILPAPAPSDSVPLAMAWHIRSDDDPGIFWLREKILELVA